MVNLSSPRDFKLGSVRIKFDEWVHTFGIAKIATSGAYWVLDTTIEWRGVTVAKSLCAQTDSEADAIAFANSRSAIDSRQQSASAPWNPPSLASD